MCGAHGKFVIWMREGEKGSAVDTEAGKVGDLSLAVRMKNECC